MRNFVLGLLRLVKMNDAIWVIVDGLPGTLIFYWFKLSDTTDADRYLYINEVVVCSRFMYLSCQIERHVLLLSLRQSLQPALVLELCLVLLLT